ncbi:hypothetical protein EOD39_16211 [Acipenser ruthenus]|uniref:Uncharacterized protein n=1 Tax=Acipenser ruthenus TaxID=7906 RepID=A0A444V6N4_ACIRT|nr:hypothetical protein EOD39_16211 [Acipenser ruthenus]
MRAFKGGSVHKTSPKDHQVGGRDHVKMRHLHEDASNRKPNGALQHNGIHSTAKAQPVTAKERSVDSSGSAKSGDSLVQYLWAHACERDAVQYLWARACERDAVQYLRAHTCERDAVQYLRARACERDAVQYLRARACERDAVQYLRARACERDAVQYLRARACERDAVK